MPVNRLITKEKVSIYAEALFDAAANVGERDEVLMVRDQLKEVARALRTNEELSSALTDSEYSVEQRCQLASEIFKGCHPCLASTLGVMVERGDIKLVGQVFSAYEDRLDQTMNLCVVEVVTAVPLDEDLRGMIVQKAEADLDRAVVLRESIDASMIGGIIINVRGMRIDASIPTQLAHARSVLKTNNFS